MEEIAAEEIVRYRALGATGAQVSEIGMGCNRLGEPQMPTEHWVGLVRHAVALGITLFDTAEAYGWGASEDILGEAIGNRDDVMVADKVCRIRETGEKDWSPDRILLRLDESLRRLRRECIDIYQLHSPTLEEMQRYDWPLAMERAKEAGKIRFSGVSINDAACGRWLIEQRLVDVLQVPFNMLEPNVGHSVFGLAAEAGMGILVRVPMAQGILTGKFRPDREVPEGHRAHLAGERMPRLIARAEGFRPLAEESGIPMGQLALRYCLSQRGVSAAIPGARTIEQLTANVAASNGDALSAGLLERIAAVQASWE
jgi:aryl-alcohol dehydrogenase-like predicted oxidoreductase